MAKSSIRRDADGIRRQLHRRNLPRGNGNERQRRPPRLTQSNERLSLNLPIPLHRRPRRPRLVPHPRIISRRKLPPPPRSLPPSARLLGPPPNRRENALSAPPPALRNQHHVLHYRTLRVSSRLPDADEIDKL